MTLAWHFLNYSPKFPQGVLRTGEAAPPDGEWLEFKDKVKICLSGLHASEKVMDALEYAPGHILCRVKCAEVVDRHYDKLVCRKRKILWRIDAEAVLRGFARRCALDVVHHWDAPEIVIQWLRFGREEDWENANYAAYSAARSTTKSAAQYAAQYAALSAYYAARSTAQSAAYAAYSAARSASLAVYSAAEFACEATFQEMRKRQESMLASMIEEAQA